MMSDYIMPAWISLLVAAGAIGVAAPLPTWAASFLISLSVAGLVSAAIPYQPVDHRLTEP